MVLHDDRTRIERAKVVPATPAHPKTKRPDQRLYWDQWHREHDHASHIEHADDARGRFLSALRPERSEPPLRILEIGCGQGRDAIQLALDGLDVMGLDHSSVAIERARAAQEAELVDVDIEWREHDYAERLPVPDDHFDGVYSHLSLHYLNEAATSDLFDDIARVLKPNGLLFFTVRADGDDLYGKGHELDNNLFCHNGHVRHFFDVGYTEELLSNWRGVDVERYDTIGQTINPGEFIRARATKPSAE